MAQIPKKWMFEPWLKHPNNGHLSHGSNTQIQADFHIIPRRHFYVQGPLRNLNTWLTTPQFTDHKGVTYCIRLLGFDNGSCPSVVTGPDLLIQVPGPFDSLIDPRLTLILTALVNTSIPAYT